MSEALDILRGSDDSDARSFIDTYESISESDLRYLSIEEIAIAAEISTPRLAELLVSASILQNKQVVTIMTATAHRKVVAKSIEMALQDRGIRDREHIHNAVGFLPTQKGTTFIGKVSINKGGTVESDSEGPDIGPDLPSMEQDLKDLNNIALNSKLLGTGS